MGVVIEIGARARGSAASCPDCGERSHRVHSHYQRCLADAAIGAQPVRIQPRVRRFTCAQVSCARKIFAEQVEGLTVRCGRHSQLLRTMLQAIGLALAGRAGARLALRLASPVSLALPSEPPAFVSSEPALSGRGATHRRPQVRRAETHGPGRLENRLIARRAGVAWGAYMNRYSSMCSPLDRALEDPTWMDR